MYARHITTTAPEVIYNEIKAKGWSFKELLLLGYEAKKNNPVLINRIQEQELKLEKLSKRLAYYIGLQEEK